MKPLLTFLIGVLVGGLIIFGVITARIKSFECPVARYPKSNLDNLLDAIEWVESRGDENAIGGDGEVGAYQITKAYIDDVNSRSPSGYYHRECLSPEVSRLIVKEYWYHYATKLRLGHEPTLEDMARIHNGGPNGWKKESTKKYWEKVKKVLDRDI